MKYLLIFSISAIFAISAKAQEGCGLSHPADSSKYIASGVWQMPVNDLKETAKECYFKVMDMINQKIPWTKGDFEKALNQYDYFRKVIDLKLSNKKDRDQFHNWLVAEARAAGKLTYEEDKPSKL